MMKRKLISIALATAMVVGSAPMMNPSAQGATENNEQEIWENRTPADADSYELYANLFTGYNTLESKITLGVDDIAEGVGYEIIDDYDGAEGAVVLVDESDSVTFSFWVESDMKCNVAVRYISASDKNGALEQTVCVDGEIPFNEISYIVYKRAYQDSGEVKVDSTGNDIKPSVEELKFWMTQKLSDPNGYISEPFVFGFTAGEHTLTFSGQRGSVAIAEVVLMPIEEDLSYADVSAAYISSGYTKYEGSSKVYEAEEYAYKSDVSIAMTNDRTSAATYPQDAFDIKLNCLGGTKWQTPGQSVTYHISAPEDGLYKISIRYKQSFKSGLHVSRKLMIDGEVPFKQAQAIRFQYSNDWQNKTFGDDENGDYWFYLEKGDHTLTFEVCIGGISEYLGVAEDSLTELNSIYREILLITGSTADVDRDYEFDRKIPHTIEKLGEEYERLSKVSEAIKKEAGNKSAVAVIDKLLIQLENMHTDPETIAKNLAQFKANIGSLGTWLYELREQPLTIDCITLHADGATDVDRKAGFFEEVWFAIKCFFASYFKDYNNIGQSADVDSDIEIDVWIQSGRDQANILRQLIDEKFSSQHNIKVNLKLVAAGSLLPSVLAGEGPDIALGNAIGDPINYALRNAVVDLTQFDDYEEITKRFADAAMIPYSYDGKTYALPETMTFPMFFYRTDIFEELGLEAPKTWDDMKALIPVLQRNSMTMAFPKGLSGYSLVLYKNGGELYKNGGETSAFDTDVALDSFSEYTDLFTLWQLPMDYSFENRFRTGEMPCGIVDYSMYNTLTVYAPEIKGLWDFIPVPGNEEGESVSVASGTNAMILKGCENVDAAWEFVKWWTDANTQSLYGIELESALGAAAKHPTANIDALMQMSWSHAEASNIVSALDDVRAIPEVPGGYYTSQVIDFATSKVYNNMDNPVEVLEDYNGELNKELARKREEFSGK